MRLRIRSQNGILNVGENLTEESLLEELKIEIQNLTNINIKDQCLKANFPPTSITKPNNSTLADCGISDGDQIILIESKDFASTQMEQSNVTPSPTKTTEIPPTLTDVKKPEPLPHSTEPKITNTSTTSTNSAKPEPLPHNTEQTTETNTNNISESSASNNNNNSNNKSKMLPSSCYPSTSNGKAVETTDGILIIKEIPDDNSCLFNSICNSK